MLLVITEKPSVARSIANVIGAYKRQDGYFEGSGYLVSWCIGHLVELAEPQDYDERYSKWRMEDLPILPQSWQYKVSPVTAAQFKVIKKLMERNDVTELIEATDAGREGELIFRLVYHQAKCNKPFKRLWISSMEDSAIRDGFANLKESADYDSLFEAALARSQADWLVGINGTRLFTRLYNKKLTVGRVQTPTLAMVVDRQNQIDSFEKKPYWNVHLPVGGADLVKEKLFDRSEAEEIAEACRNQSVKIEKAEQSEKTLSPPKLYDLTTLQREANRYYGYTALKTLEDAQSLYEKKLVTYPRTDSQHLTNDMADTAAHMVHLAGTMFGLTSDEIKEPDIFRVLNSSKVSDHHAIILTAEVEKQDIFALSQGERDILLLIAMRLLAATGTEQCVAETELVVSCAGHEFKAKGKTILELGWKAYENLFRDRIGAKKKDREKLLPVFPAGQCFDPVEPSITEHFTAPPKAYTEDTLLSALETAGNDSFDEDTEKKGLGTPATRASMIEKLISNRYLQRKGKQLIPTADGTAMAGLLPEEVKSPELTADWENALMCIERGELAADAFMRDICRMVSELTNKYRSLKVESNPFSKQERPQKDQIGICPRCGSAVYEGSKSFYCSNRDCSFCLWKDSRWLAKMQKKITKEIAASLLKDGRAHVTGLYSERKGCCFDAFLVLEDAGEHVNLKLSFDNPKKTKKKG